MSPKTAPTTVTASRSADVQDTSMADAITINNGSDRVWFRDIL